MTICPPDLSLHNRRPGERGNMLFIVLIALVLIGALTAAITSSTDSESSNIDDETLTIRITEVQRHAAEVERAVAFLMQSGLSESDIRFAHPDAPSDYGDLPGDATPENQVFHKSGGAATYRDPPDGVNDGEPWEFYGKSHLPGVGTDKADLIAVLPNVTDQFCSAINKALGQNNQPSEDAECLDVGTIGRFNDAHQFFSGGAVNLLDETSFTQDSTINAAQTAMQACVFCKPTNKNNFYHVLMAR